MPFSANYTGRWKIAYTSFGNPHTFTLRLPPSIGAPTATHAASLQGALDAAMLFLPRNFQVLDGEYSAAGDDFFIPAVYPTTNGNQETEGYDQENVANMWEEAGELKFHWKGPGGNKTNISIFGFNVDAFTAATSLKHRAPTTALAFLTTMRNKLGELPIAGSDGIQATIRNYVTFQYNSYWEAH